MKFFRTQYFLLFVVMVTVAGLSASARADELYVVSARPSLNQDLNHSGGAGGLDELRAIFLGEKLFWNDNERVTAFLPDFNQPGSEIFVQQALGMDRQQYIAHWRRKLFAGKGHPPKETSGEEQVLQLIRGTVGGITVLPHRPKNAKGLQVLSVDFLQNRITETSAESAP